MRPICLFFGCHIWYPSHLSSVADASILPRHAAHGHRAKLAKYDIPCPVSTPTCQVLCRSCFMSAILMPGLCRCLRVAHQQADCNASKELQGSSSHSWYPAATRIYVLLHRPACFKISCYEYAGAHPCVASTALALHPVVMWTGSSSQDIRDCIPTYEWMFWWLICRGVSAGRRHQRSLVLVLYRCGAVRRGTRSWFRSNLRRWH